MPSITATRRTLTRLLVCVAALAVPSSALADCSHDIIDQAYKGSITKHYSQACYNAAIRIEPVDGSSYSDIDSIIKSAKRADALRDEASPAALTSSNKPRSPQAHAQTGPAITSKPESPSPSALVGGGRDQTSNTGTNTTKNTGTTSTPDVTLLGAPSATPVLDHLAPAHAGDVPIAVVVLGVLALLLVLAGIAGVLVRRRASRSDS
jgi:hypothetical protein